LATYIPALKQTGAFASAPRIGAIASGRVPAGNARGDLLGSWLNPTSVSVGALAIATSSYLAAVYLAGNARRLGQRTLERDFRARALLAGLVAGALAIASLLVVRADAPPLGSALTRGGGLVMVCTSATAGVLTLLLVVRRHFEAARASAGLAVGAIVAGWAFAQYPRFLPGLTIEQAAAERSTLVAVLIGVGAGAFVLVPALVLLFGLFLRGAWTEQGRDRERPEPRGPARGGRAGDVDGGRFDALMLGGSALMIFADSGWAHAVGVASLFAAAASTFVLAADISGERADG